MIVLANDHFEYFSCPSLTHYKDNLNDIHISARHKSRMKNKCEENWEYQESLSINCLPFRLSLY